MLRLAFAALALASFSVGSLAESMDNEAYFRQANEQVLLAERMSKLWAQVGVDLEAARAGPALARALERYEQNLKELRSRASADDLRENYALLNQVWREYGPILKAAPTAKDAEKLVEGNDELVYIAQKGSDLMELRTRNIPARAIQHANRAALLAQRMGKLYLLHYWGVRLEFIGNELKTAETEFLEQLAKLKAFPGNDEHVALALRNVDAQRVFLQNAIKEPASGDARPAQARNVSTTSDRLAEILEDVARRYEITGR
jgi:hypothetical protein